MATVINLTQQSVIAEIESVLDTYSYHPYQQAFAIPELRQELIAYVLNRIPCFYESMGTDNICDLSNKLPRNPLEHQIHIQNLIHQGIQTIIKDKSEWISHHLCSTVEPGCEPSHWFG
ncbi:MAG: late competence development ComFB family protein [Calothrix sp. MO_167.B12]|nr:late competence development ComFB family protein [Calothrix sp. MO_167.B12]